MTIFTVLHLSDLHIGGTSEEPSFNRLRNSLIDDVRKVITEKSIDLDTVAVTGDIVDRGGSLDAFINAKDFINNLLLQIKVPPENVVIVPGNHDIPRISMLNGILEDISKYDFDTKNTSHEHWKILGIRFVDFFQFQTSITGLESSPSIFGGEVKDVITPKGVLRVLMFNSAWACHGDQDYKKLCFGRWQLEELKETCDVLKPADLVIGLSHHPFEWLNPAEQDNAMKFMTSSQGLKVDVLLHGHVHDGVIKSLGDPDGYLTQLISGIGYPEIDKRKKGSPKLSKCRYAIYRFDVTTGQVEIWLRVTREDGTFVSDTTLYSEGGDDGHFFYPYKRVTVSSSKIISSPTTIEVDPMPFTWDWVGRTDQIDLLLNPELRAVAITGMGGQGKTALAAQFQRSHARGDNNSFEVGVWVDCKALPDSLHVKTIDLLDALSEGTESASLYRDEKIDDTVKRFLKHLNRKKYLIVFDNIDAYVNPSTEMPSKDLKPIFEMLVNNEHKSLVIFTCRSPFIDHRGTFRQIELKGLDIEEGKAYFEKRGIKLTGDNKEDYCSKLIKLTNGHPLWLGLIAGQLISSKGSSLKILVYRFERGEVTTPKDYFSDIWRKMKKEHQRILRYIVEAPHPLSEEEINIAINELGPSKLRQEIRRLGRLGLLEPHEGKTIDAPAYQVHPLVRQFVHESFTTKEQKPFVSGILCIFLNLSFVEGLFSNVNSLDELDVSMPIEDIVASIETCVNSGNQRQALELLERYHSKLHESGYHHKFQFLACRVLDNVDWKELDIVNRERGSMLVGELIYQLDCKGEGNRSKTYLKKYALLAKQNTIYYLPYLGVASLSCWQQEDYSQAIRLTDEYGKLETKLELVKNPNILLTKALALRESGQAEEALQIFEQFSDNDAIDIKARAIGNRARCLLQLSRYPEAEDLLRESLALLNEEQSYNAKTNLGYAFLWLAEVFFKQGKVNDAKTNILFAREVWLEYAPGHLSQLKELESFLDDTDKEINPISKSS